ncbi:hypothetical protein [Bacillus sp. AK031]
MILFLILYYSFCLLYGMVSIGKKFENGIIKTIIITFFPVLGLLLAHFLFKEEPFYREESEAEADIQGKAPEVRDCIEFLDVEQEISWIPFSDALLLEDDKLRRKLLKASLKGNLIQNAKLVSKALKSDDSETAYYAATVIMEMQRKIVNIMQELTDKREHSPDDPEFIASYIEILRDYIDSGFIDKETIRKFQGELSVLLEKILESELSSKDYFISKIECDLAIGREDKADEYSQLFMDTYPNDEDSYLMALKVFHSMQNRHMFEEVLSRLKRKPINLSLKGLNTLHFWS